MTRNKYLGIPFDYWHFILAIAVTLAAFVVMYATLNRPEVGMGEGWVFFISVLFGMLISHHLQAYNEARQAIDKTVELKYGSWYRFQQNSIRDWRLFYMGWLLSPIVCGLVSLLF